MNIIIRIVSLIENDTILSHLFLDFYYRLFIYLTSTYLNMLRVKKKKKKKETF